MPLIPLLVFAAVLLVPGIALANWGSEFSAMYPSSSSDNNASCQLCHGPSTSYLNSYGKALFDTGSAPPDFSAVEASNSDGDPTGSTNIQEINAGTQPGWTAGPTNTLYNRSTGAVAAINQNPPASVVGSLDPVVVPDTAILWGPASLTSNPNATFNFSATVSGSTFACRLDAGSWAACTTPKDYTGLAAGSHVFDVRATAGGSTDATPATYTWTIDKTPPSTSIDSGPSDPTIDPLAIFTFSSSDGNRFRCWLDGMRIPRSGRRGGAQLCSSPFQVTVAAGTHTFRVGAIDPAGNADPIGASWTWTYQP